MTTQTAPPKTEIDTTRDLAIMLARVKQRVLIATTPMERVAALAIQAAIEARIRMSDGKQGG
jgi:hypothetical protein